MNQEEIRPQSKLVKDVEIPQFSGVTRADFARRIAAKHTRLSRIPLFSHRILSRIQRRFTTGIAAIRFGDIAPLTLEFLWPGRRATSRDIRAPNRDYLGTPSALPLRRSLPRASVESGLGQTDSQPVRGEMFSTVKGWQRSGHRLLVSETLPRVLSVRHQEGMIHRDFLQKKDDRYLQSDSIYRTSGAVVIPEGRSVPLWYLFSLSQWTGEGSEPFQMGVAGRTYPGSEGIGILRSAVSPVPLAISGPSFGSDVVEGPSPEFSGVEGDIPRRIAQWEPQASTLVKGISSQMGQQLSFTTFHSAAPTVGRLIPIQRRIGQPGTVAEIKGIGAKSLEKGAFRGSTTQSSRSFSDGATSGLMVVPGYSLLDSDGVDEGANSSIQRSASSIQHPVSSIQYPIPPDTSETPNRPVLMTRSGAMRKRASERLSSRVGVFRRSAMGAEIPNNMLVHNADNAMSILRRYLGMPYVRLHSDVSANFMAARLDAKAFTIGRDVFFASRKLDFSTPSGIALLSHELTHVRQQERQSTVPGTGEMEPSQYRALEYEALTNEQAILSLLNTGHQKLTSHQNNPLVARKHIPGPGEGTQSSEGEAVELTYTRFPQIEYAARQEVPTSMMTEAGRGVEAVPSEEFATPPAPEPAKPSIDINRVAEEVYRIIERKLRSEKERRGYF